MPSARRIAGLAAVAGVAVLGLAAPARAAATYQVVTENLSVDPGEQVGVVSYASLPDVFSGSFTSGAFTPISPAAGYSVAGLTHDAGGYRLVTENTKADVGAQVGIVTYATLPDLLSGNLTSGGFTQIITAAGYKIAGLAWDGSAYQLLTENLNAPVGEQVGLITYNSFNDLLNGTFASGGFTQISFAAGYQIGGFTWDGTAYQLMTENLSVDPGQQIGVISYNTLTDLRNGTFATGGFTQISVAAGYKIVGFAATITDAGNGGGGGIGGVGAVPEPGAWALMLVGFGGLGLSVRRRRRPVCA